MEDHFKIALLDLNAGVQNEGMRCIKMIAGQFLAQEGIKGSYDVFDVRIKNEVPDIKEYDMFISSGGPGAPKEAGETWEWPFFKFLDGVLTHNLINQDKKFLFLICHSYQLACLHWNLAKVNKRRSTSFGIMPVHKTQDGEQDSLFEGLNNPFYVVDSRDYQVVSPKKKKIKSLGGSILCREKMRANISLERAVMAIRFTKEIVGTQFHPEADAEGMMRYFLQEDKRRQIVKRFGKKKYVHMIESLEDDDKIMMTHRLIIPCFMNGVARQILQTRLVEI